MDFFKKENKSFLNVLKKLKKNLSSNPALVVFLSPDDQGSVSLEKIAGAWVIGGKPHVVSGLFNWYRIHFLKKLTTAGLTLFLKPFDAILALGIMSWLFLETLFLKSFR